MVINGQELQQLERRLVSLTLTDNRGMEADMLEFTLSDSDTALVLPSRGVKIALSLGWSNQPLVEKGTYIVDEINHFGPPDLLTVVAKSANFRGEFNVKRSASWHQVKLKDLISTLAERYQLTAGVSEELGVIEIEHADQTDETDINFLSRLAELYGAIATVKNDYLLFMTRGKGMTVSGRPLPVIEIPRDETDSYLFHVSDRMNYSGVITHWQNLMTGVTEPVIVRVTPQHSETGNPYINGTADNLFVMRRIFQNERLSSRAAREKLNQLRSEASSLELSLSYGRADLIPEQPVFIKEFKTSLEREYWTITHCTHRLDLEGFTTELKLEANINPLESATMINDEMDLKWLNVPKGQLTFNSEGNDSEPYFSRLPHVPGGGSGITYGRGLDLKGRTADEVVKLFEFVDRYCVPIADEMLTWLCGGVRLSGAGARDYLSTLNQHVPAEKQQLTRKQQHFLFLAIYPTYLEITIRVLTKEDVVEAYGSLDWDAVPEKVKDVLVDLTYRGDNYGTTRRRIMPALLEDQRTGAVGRNSKFYELIVNIRRSHLASLY